MSRPVFADPVVQYIHRPGVIDLGWGHPDPELLPVAGWQRALETALREFGSQALAYGAPQGPGPLVEWIRRRAGQVDGRVPEPDEILVTAGASQAIDLLASATISPGDVVVVESPTYHLALRILAGRGAHLVPAPGDELGLDPLGTAELIEQQRRLGRRVAMMYLVPTFGNPTGRSLPAERRRALAALSRESGVIVVEDDTYRELAYDGAAPSSIWGCGEPGLIARVGSFSKTVAPGLRLGWITASAPLVRGLAGGGLIDSGGGLNHTTALAMAAFGESGNYERHLDRIRPVYRLRRDTLVNAVAARLPELSFTAPEGGWFLWLRLPVGMTSGALRVAAADCGVDFVEGTRFCVEGGEDRLRLAFSLFDPPALEEGVARLRGALDRARCGSR